MTVIINVALFSRMRENKATFIITVIKTEANTVFNPFLFLWVKTLLVQGCKYWRGVLRDCFRSGGTIPFLLIVSSFVNKI